MNRENEPELSRRAVLKRTGLVAGLGLLSAFASVPLGSSFVSANENRAEGKGNSDGGDAQSIGVSSEFVYIDGVHAEYLATIAAFPFALPRGFDFPPESGLQDYVPGGLWQRGCGTGEAYFLWHDATVAAAEDAAARGDRSEAARLLEILDGAHKSKMRKAVWDDAGEVFSSRIAQARKGDLLALHHLTVS